MRRFLQSAAATLAAVRRRRSLALTTGAIAWLSLMAQAAMAEPRFHVTAADRHDVIAATAALLESRYVYADRGVALAEELRQAAAGGQWNHLDDPRAFAEAITEYLRRESGDGHLGLDYSRDELPPDSVAAEESYSQSETERWYGAHLNHGFEKIERLDGNVGYLDLRVFAPTALAGDVAAAAMTLLAQSNALIIDLRNNGGGHGEMAHLLMAYLLDRSREVSGSYNRPQDKYARATTPAWVPGRRFGGEKPVYVLISGKTFSAAEAFAYDLQAMGRAVVVGEPSGGGAHPFEYRRVHPHFMLSLAEGRSINPITGGNWQGTGVIPDVRVAADEALAKALELTSGGEKGGARQQRRHGPEHVPQAVTGCITNSGYRPSVQVRSPHDCSVLRSLQCSTLGSEPVARTREVPLGFKDPTRAGQGEIRTSEHAPLCAGV